MAVKNHSQFNFYLPECLKPVWWPLQAECPHALAPHLRRSWNREQSDRSCGVLVWAAILSVQPSKISIAYTPSPQNSLIKFCFSINGLKQEASATFVEWFLILGLGEGDSIWQVHRSSQISEKHILEKQIPVRHNEAKKSSFPNNAALSVRWEHNIWSFSAEESSRDYLASWLSGICTLPDVAKSSQERETMTPKLPLIQLHCFSWNVKEEGETLWWWVSTVLRNYKTWFYVSTCFQQAKHTEITIPHQY